MFKVYWVKEVNEDGSWHMKSGSTVVEAKNKTEAFWKLSYDGFDVIEVERI